MVAEITLENGANTIRKIQSVHNIAHLPVGVGVQGGSINRADLNEWWIDRSIPYSRDGLYRVLMDLNLSNTQSLLDKSFGLSLSDQYWICPIDSGLTWNDVNFFDKSFSEDMGNALVGNIQANEEIDLMSPDNTSDGWLKKRWTIINGNRCLLKAGGGAVQQEPYNEVFASAVMSSLSIPHVEYSLIQDDNGYPFSVCKDFITQQTELVTAWNVMKTVKKENHVSVYSHFLNCCEKLNISDIQTFVDGMIITDFIIANEDRHQNNFGVIRNAETLEYVGAAPIYDSGSSLWLSTPTSRIKATESIPCKPFKNSHIEQIKLVSSFENFDVSSLSGIEDKFREIVKDSFFVDKARTDAIAYAIKGRVKMLVEISKSHTKSEYATATENDVRVNIRYSGQER